MRLFAPMLRRPVQFLAICGLAALCGSAGSAAACAQAAASRPTPPIVVAAAKGDIALVKALAATGAAVNATDGQGRTALIAAVANKQTTTVHALVAAGADMNIEAKSTGSALNLAENSDDAEMAAFLLAAGAKSTGKSVGDVVCVRPWGGEGFCGTVKVFSVRAVQISVTKLVGCAGGCPARQECSAANPVGGVNGLHPGEQIVVPSWCLTHTAVKQ